MEVRMLQFMKLKDAYLSLCELEAQKRCLVKARIHETSINWCWKSWSNDDKLSSELARLSKEIASTRL